MNFWKQTTRFSNVSRRKVNEESCNFVSWTIAGGELFKRTIIFFFLNQGFDNEIIRAEILI